LPEPPELRRPRQEDRQREHQRSAPAPAARVRAAVREMAEAWGALWEEDGGRLALPLAAGLRRGRLDGRLRVEEEGKGSRLVLVEDARTYHLQGNAVAVLLISAAGALAMLLWPFFPEILPLAVGGGVLALLGWFLVISRLTTNSPEDFLAMVVESASASAETHGDEEF